MRVKVFVKIDIDHEQEVINGLGVMGFVIEHRSDVEKDVFIGAVEKDNIENLKTTPFVVNVWTDIEHELF